MRVRYVVCYNLLCHQQLRHDVSLRNKVEDRVYIPLSWWIMPTASLLRAHPMLLTRAARMCFVCCREAAEAVRME